GVRKTARKRGSRGGNPVVAGSGEDPRALSLEAGFSLATRVESRRNAASGPPKPIRWPRGFLAPCGAAGGPPGAFLNVLLFRTSPVPLAPSRRPPDTLSRTHRTALGRGDALSEFEVKPVGIDKQQPSVQSQGRRASPRPRRVIKTIHGGRAMPVRW